MPTKLGNGGTSQEAYNPQDGKYTDEGNISQEEREELEIMKLFGIRPTKPNLPERKPKLPEIIKKRRIENQIKKDFDMFYETEQNTPTFDDIYNDYIEKNKKEPSDIRELLDFVRQEINNHYIEGYKKGQNYEQLQHEMPYYIKQKAVSTPDIPKKEKAVAVSNPTEKPISPGSYVTKTGPSFRIDVADGTDIDPGFINDKVDPNFKPGNPLFRFDMPEEEKKFDEIYEKLFNGGKQ